MAEIASAFVSLIPSAKGFGTKTEGVLGPQMAAAGHKGGLGFAKGAALGITAGIGAAVAATKGLYEIGQTFEEVRKSIIVGTGASGEALDSLEASARRIGQTTPSSFKDVGQAVADLNTRLGLTGKPLETVTSKILNLSRITDTDVGTNIANITRLFGDWSIKTGDQSEALDKIFEATKQTGIGLSELTTKTVQFGAPLRQFGFSFEQSLALFGKWEKEGVNTQVVLAGLKAGLGKFSKAGKDPVKALRDTQKAIANAGSAGEANKIAIENFGQRAGPDMAAAVREGRFELGSLAKGLKGAGGAIDDADSRTRTFHESWQLFKNNTLVAIQPLATKVFDSFTTGFATVLPKASKAVGQIGGAVGKMMSGFDASGTLSSFSSTLGSIGDTANAKLLPALHDFADAVLPSVIKLGQRVSDALGPAFQQIGDAVNTKLIPAISTLLPILAPVAKFLLDMFGGALVGVIKGAVKVITGLVDVIAGVINFVDDLVHGRWSQLWGDFKQIISGALTAIIGALQVWWNMGVLAIFKRGFVFLTKGIWERGWTLLKGIGERALQGVGRAIAGGVAGIGRVMLAGVRGYLGIWKGLFGFLRAVVVNGLKVLRSAFGGAMAAIRSVVSHVLSGVAGVFKSALSAAKNAVSTGLSKVVTLFKNLPGKVLGALKSLGGSLAGVGRDIVQGLINGIKGMAGDVTRALLALLPGPLKKFAGKLGIGSPSKVFHEFGRNVGEGFVNGVDSQGRKVGDAMDRMAKKAGDRAKKRLEALRDKLTGTLGDLKSQAESIASSITGAFRPDLFSGTLGALVGGLAGGLANVQAALAAFPKLIAAGVNGEFLQQLLGSGNTQLIAALAASPQQAAALQGQFNQLQQLSGQLGQQAANQATSSDIAQVTAELKKVNAKLAKAAKENGKETANALNHTAAAAKRRKRKVA